MLTEKYLFKIHRNGQVERIQDYDNIKLSDVVKGLGIPLKKVECKPIKNSGIYAFSGSDSEVLIFGVPAQPERSRAEDVVHGILASQFKVLSTLQGSLA